MRTRLESPDVYTIGWIAALPIERGAATAMLDDRHETPESFNQHQSDTNSYTWGRMHDHNVVIASLPAGVYGTTSAATTASNLLMSLPHIRVGLLVGIGGGIARPDDDQDIRLGDIAVSQPSGTAGGVIQYDLRKATSNKTWEPKGSLNKPPPVLLAALASLQAEHEVSASRVPDLLQEMWAAYPDMKRSKNKTPGYVHQGVENDRLFRSDYNHTNGKTCIDCDISGEIKRDQRDTIDPEIHYGIIASGNTLFKDATTRDEVVELTGGQCICVEMEAAGLMDHFPCLVIRGICDYADSHKTDQWQRYASATAAAYTKELLAFVPVRHLEATPRAIDVIRSISKGLESLQFTASDIKEGVQGLSTNVLNIDQKIVLDRLPVASGASFDSHEEEQNPTCLGETRVELLNQIKDWVQDSDAESVFWLNGMAGTGKSTISRTIAGSLTTTGHLGANFFFKRGEGDRGSSSKLFTTIAAQLARTKPAIAPYIKNAIDADAAIGVKGLQEQFEKLILNPLSAISHNEGDATSTVILIDALDECEAENTAIKLIISLFGLAKNIGLRVFITSRPELPIRLGFHSIDGNYHGLILHEIPEAMIKRDISIFLKHELAKIRGEYNASVPEHRQLATTWPGESNTESLVEMAIPLFIFASTVCRFLADRKSGNPDKKLRQVLTYQTSSQESKLNATYLPILEQQVSGLSQKEKDGVLREFRDIVGSIIILASPLSIAALAEILGMPRDTIDDRLDLLHSVLSIPPSSKSPVRLLHLSFRDFLVDSEKREINQFWIDKDIAHQALAANCLRVMNRLKQDICDIKVPGTPRSTINPEQINIGLPPEIQYACLFWVYHTQEAGIHLADGDQFHSFLTYHFLHWIEALSLMGRASESLSLIKILQSLLKPQHSSQLSDFLDDAMRFILANISTIDTVPLQLYSSLLLFAPEGSKVRMSFQGEMARWISLRPKIQNDWSRCLQALEGHTDNVNSVAFSHDSALVASASDDQTIRIWRTDTGKHVQSLEGHTLIVRSVVFSHDSVFLASASEDQNIRIWLADTGACVRVLNGHSLGVNSVVFSHNSKLIASGSDDKTIRIWDTDTSDYVKVIEGHTAAVRSVAFSHDSSLVASSSLDKSIRIWRTDTGDCRKSLRGHKNRIDSVVFSHDSALLASASIDRTIRIWDADTGDCVRILGDHNYSFASAAFSPNSTLLISGSNDWKVRIWRVDTGDCIQSLEGHSDYIRSVAFSSNSALIASGSFDKTIRIWRTDIGGHVQAIEGHESIINSVTFSYNSELIASASDDEMIRIWRSDTGECIQTLKDHSVSVRSVIFSHDSALVLSVSATGTIRVWRINTGECVQGFMAHSDFIRSVTFSHDSALIASTSDDKTIRIWRTNTGKRIRTLEGHSDVISSATFSHSLALVASASYDQTIRVWRIDTGECIQILEGHLSFLRSAVFSHDSALVASVPYDYAVRIWRTDTGECIQTLEGHKRFIRSVAFSDDSRLIASSSEDQTIRIWRTHTGECIQEVDIGGTSSHLSFEPGNLRLLTDVGTVVIDGIASSARTSTNSLTKAVAGYRSGYGISRDRSWITWNGDNLLWLPVEFRPNCSAVSGSTVVMGCHSGKIMVIGFASSKLPSLQ